MLRIWVKVLSLWRDNRKNQVKQNKRYMEKHLFLGDEAVAQAAIDAGLSGVYAYPGTPSTEIT